MEDQSYDGGIWNKQAFELLKLLGWERIGDRDMDVLGDDNSKMGVDTIVCFNTPLKTRPQVAILEAKHYKTTSFSKSDIEDWLYRLDSKLVKLRNSEAFQDRFPMLTECTVLDTGLIVIWFHDTENYSNFNSKFKEILRQISISGRQRKAGTNKIYVVDNERLMRMFALVEELDEIRKTSEFNFVYSQAFTGGKPVKRSEVLTIENIFSDVLFGEEKTKDDIVKSHIFYFGKNDYNSLKLAKGAYAKTVNYDTSKEIILHVFNPDTDFRKIENDIKTNIFHEFKISIRKMGLNINLPTFILNIEDN